MTRKRYACETTLTLLHWLDSYGCRVIDGQSTHELSVSKIAGYAALRQCGIRVPRTVSAVGKQQLLAAAQSFAAGGKRFLAKHNRGGSGSGVVLFESLHEFESYLTGTDFQEPVDGITLIQQFIETAEPTVTRVELVDCKLLYGVKILVDAEFNPQNCPADSCAGTNCPMAAGADRPRKFTILHDLRKTEPELVKQYEQFVRENNVEVCGIEFAKDDQGRTWTYDVNVNTNYNRSAERRAKVNGGGSAAVAALISRALQEWVST